MYVVIRDHILEGDSLEDLAEVREDAFRYDRMVVCAASYDVKEQAGEYGSEGQALLAVIKGDREKYKIDYQSKDSPFL